MVWSRQFLFFKNSYKCIWISLINAMHLKIQWMVEKASGEKTQPFVGIQ